jgi:hypothetical protein
MPEQTYTLERNTEIYLSCVYGMAEQILLSPSMANQLDPAIGRYFYSESLGFGEIKKDRRLPSIRIELENEGIAQHREVGYFDIQMTITEDSLVKEAILSYKKRRGNLFSN